MKIIAGTVEVEAPNWLVFSLAYLGVSIYNSKKETEAFTSSFREFSKPQNIFDVPALRPRLKEQLDKMPTQENLPNESLVKPNDNQ